MGEHNQLKYGVEVTRASGRAFGIDELEQATTRVSETLTPVADLWSMPEWAFLRKEYRWVASNAAVAVALDNSTLVTFVPPSVDLISVVERIEIHGGAGGVVASITVAAATATTYAGVAMAGIIAADALDLRVPGSFGGALTTIQTQRGQFTTVAAVSGRTIARVAVPAGDTEVVQLGLVLAPGTGVAVVNEAVNLAIAAIMYGRERRPHPNEMLLG